MLAGIKYVFKNLFKPIALILTIYLLLSKSPDEVLDSGFWGIALLFFLCINVTTVYDFGEFLVIFTEAGVSLAVGLIFYFLFKGLVVWLVTNGVIVAGILIIFHRLFAVGISAQKLYDTCNSIAYVLNYPCQVSFDLIPPLVV